MPRKTSLIDVYQVKNFPLDDEEAVVVKAAGGILYVQHRYRRWNNTTKKEEGTSVNLGRIHNNVYYTMEEYHKLFKRGGKPRLKPKPPSVYRVKKRLLEDAAEAAEQAASEAAAKREPALEKVELKEFDPPLEKAPEPPLMEANEEQIGITPLLYGIAKNNGIIDDLVEAYGFRTAMQLLSLAIGQVCCSEFVAQRYEKWSSRRVLPMPLNVSDDEIGGFLNEVGKNQEAQLKLFELRRARLDENELCSFDSTTLPTESENICEARVGKSKEGSFEQQVHLGLLYGHKTNTPVLCRLFDGNVPDTMTFGELLREFDATMGTHPNIVHTVVDRGYFSRNNVELAVQTGHEFLFAAKVTDGWVSKEFIKNLKELDDFSNIVDAEKGITGFTCKIEVAANKYVWMHLFKNHKQALDKRLALIRELEEYKEKVENGVDFKRDQKYEKKYFYKEKVENGKIKLDINFRKVNNECKLLGIFANITTWECTAKESYTKYGSRDIIEKTFSLGKSGLKFDKICVHSSDSMHGRVLVGFIALSIAATINYLCGVRQKKYYENGKIKVGKSLRDEGYNLKNLVEEFDSIRLIYDKTNGYRFSEVINRCKLIAGRLGVPNAYDEMPEFISADFKSRFEQTAPFLGR